MRITFGVWLIFRPLVVVWWLSCGSGVWCASPAVVGGGRSGSRFLRWRSGGRDGPGS